MKNIIFDLDHTLLYSENLESTWFETCQKEKIDRDLIEKVWYENKGLHLWKQLEKANVLDNEKQNNIIDLFWQQYLEEAHPIAFPESEQVIKELHVNNKLFISTGSSNQAANFLLEKLNWRQYFDLILGSDLGCFKGPNHYHKIKNYLGFPDDFAENSLAVGDGQKDMFYAKEENIKHRLAVLRENSEQHKKELEKSGATNIIRSLEEIFCFI